MLNDRRVSIDRPGGDRVHHAQGYRSSVTAVDDRPGPGEYIDRLLCGLDGKGGLGRKNTENYRHKLEAPEGYKRLTANDLNDEGVLELMTELIRGGREELEHAFAYLLLAKANAATYNVAVAEHAYKRAQRFFRSGMFACISGYDADEYVKSVEEGIRKKVSAVRRNGRLELGMLQKEGLL